MRSPVPLAVSAWSDRPRRSRRATVLAILAVPVLAALTGCGSGTSTPASSASAGGPASATAVHYPVTVQGTNGAVTVAARPTAIVSLSPSSTEMLFATGAGPQIKAVDDQSSFPAQAPRTSLSGFQPNAEAIAGYSPDLVVLANDSNGLVAALTALKLPVLVLSPPATLEESYVQQVTLGTVTGHLAEAQQVVENTKRRIAAAVAAVPPSSKPLSVYHEISETYYSATSQTFIGNVYAQFGLKNIADTAGKGNDGYPQLSAEYVISAAPDLIFLTDGECCRQTPAVVSARPAFSSIPAVKNGRVVALDTDIASRWGPRTAELAEQVARALGAKI